MKKRWQKVGVLVLVMILLFGQTQTLFATEQTQKAYAFDMTFPLELKEMDDAFLTDTFYSFKGYAGQGTLLLTTQNVTKFHLYINNTPVDVSAYLRNGKHTLDIGHLTKNDANLIEVNGIEGKNASVRVQIPYPKVIHPKKSLLSGNVMTLLEDIITEEIKHGSTGAQIVVLKNGQLAYSKAFGYVNNYEPSGKPIPMHLRVPVTENTLFDLASNTKMYTVNYALQKLVYEKKISIHDRITKYFPEFKDEENAKIKGKDKLTIKELLEHQGGFPADPQYFNESYDKDDGIVNGKNDLYSQEKTKTMEMILKTPLAYEPGTNTKYSDVDYMLLGMIVEKVTGQDLDTYMKETFYKPLGLHKITFRPLDHGFMPKDIAATELNGNSRDGVITFKNNRTKTIQGTVHDEKAYYSMDGVSGHAGLFGNALDLAKLAQVMLNEGGFENLKFWDKTTQDQFVKPKDTNSSYGLGWRRAGDNIYSWAFSPMADRNTVGHTGWTGTLTVIDPKEQMVIVLLTNKKNSPLLDNKKNPNNFFADRFLVNRYGMVTTLVYQATKPTDLEHTKELLKVLVDGKRMFIEKRPEVYKNRGDEADLKALEVVWTKYQDKK